MRSEYHHHAGIERKRHYVAVMRTMQKPKLKSLATAATTSLLFLMELVMCTCFEPAGLPQRFKMEIHEILN